MEHQKQTNKQTITDKWGAGFGALSRLLSINIPDRVAGQESQIVEIF